MSSTRQRNQPLAEFTDDPELLLHGKKRNTMADSNTGEGADRGAANNQHNDDNRQPGDPQRGNPEPEPERYLPDLENKPLSEALKRAIQMKNNYEVLIECPRLQPYYRVDTLLVDKESGSCMLYIGGEKESFPLPCSLTKYPEGLLARVLEADVSQRTLLKDLPGEMYNIFITEPLTKRGLEGRLETFAELSGMYVKNQIALHYTHLLPETQKYQQITKFNMKGRKIGSRMDELLAVFTTDNDLRKAAGMKGYPIPTVIPMNKEVNTREQALRYEDEAYKEAKEIMNIAYPEVTAVTEQQITATTMVIQHSNRPSREIMQRALSPSFIMNTVVTAPPLSPWSWNNTESTFPSLCYEH